MKYCEPVANNTLYFCDWNLQLYTDVLQCYNECSSMLISKSDFNFILFLVLSLFVLAIVLFVAYVVLS